MSTAKREYMLTFTDKHTHKVSLYFLAKKSNTFTAYKQFKAWAKVHHQAVIKTFCTNCSREYTSHAFENYFLAQGTRHELTVHDSPSQNGVSECLNLMLVSCACACMVEAMLPHFLWAECYVLSTTGRSIM
jgi:hypothetical protein